MEWNGEKHLIHEKAKTYFAIITKILALFRLMQLYTSHTAKSEIGPRQIKGQSAVRSLAMLVDTLHVNKETLI